ncbi:class I SAM-dependent methyltransferase family protein [Natronomonas salina]|uniref:class I SAM-dependent methyltransferase n=1 Tax=Natronomonas salina TaxID=1710540 RepID=UPI0015B6231F|nr:class I SAM-dependent methyltransferase family protein [Natronomonas salina]QLD89727.1 class I SAM-dependent methyltransferase family protein [Natronomonas salina]
MSEGSEGEQSEPSERASGDAGAASDAGERNGPDDPELAAIVEQSRTETTIDELREEGVYDPTRSVRPHEGDRVAIPVVAAPAETTVDEVRAVELPRRERGLEDLLAGRGFTDDEIAAAPASWAVVGSVVLADFGDVSAEGALSADRREAVGDALLDLHGEADTVLARGGVSGTRREPSAEVVAGSGETETVHVEHGTKYALDLSRVMFSPGNEAERVRMGEVVEPGERVFDMFAGVGYFALPMARAGADVTAAEINPEAYRLLVENAMLNGVSDRVRAVLGDCRDVETTADRVVMGYYDASEYLDAALAALVPGGTLHLHEATPEDLFPERPIERLEAAAAEAGREVEVLETTVVKSHSAGVVHGVVDARVD